MGPPASPAHHGGRVRVPSPPPDAPHNDASSKRVRRFWRAVFFAPAFLLPIVSRLVLVNRNSGVLSLSSLVKGFGLGTVQDAAVFLQSLVLVQLALLARRCLRRAVHHGPLVDLLTSVLLCGAYLWLTLAPLADLSLQMRFLPRLNREFVVMYLSFSAEFASSMNEVLTPDLITALVMYAVWMALWVFAIVRERVEVPVFRLPSFLTVASASGSTKSLPLTSPRAAPSLCACAAPGVCLPLVAQRVAMSTLGRTAALALLLGVSALHCSLALDGNGNDIYLMSNAMYSLQMEEYLRAPSLTRVSILTNTNTNTNTNAQPSAPKEQPKPTRAPSPSRSPSATNNNSTTAQATQQKYEEHVEDKPKAKDTTPAPVEPKDTPSPAPTEAAPPVQPEPPSLYDRLETMRQAMIGPSERYRLPESDETRVQFPFYRETLGFEGPKRFSLRAPSDKQKHNKKKKAQPSVQTGSQASENDDNHVDEAPPPDILLINVESFRSRDVGVLGGRAKKAATGQTVTPFFDALSRSGVLFRQHYSPAIQTSRTLLATLLGIMPSFTESAALRSRKGLMPPVRTVAEILQAERGYETIFWSATNLNWDNWRTFLSANGFDGVYDDSKVLTYLSDAARNTIRRDERISWGYHDSVSLSALVNFLDEHHTNRRRKSHKPRDDGSGGENKPKRKKHRGKRHTPLFMDIYTISSHDPWHVPGDYQPSTDFSAFVTEHNRNYVNSLNYVDQQLEKLFKRLRERGLLKNTIVLIEGDHGHGFMEHNNPSVTTSKVYDEMTHIPLLIVADDLLDDASKGVVVDAPTTTLDLLSTLADMLGIERFEQHSMGQSLMRHGRADRPVLLGNPFERGTQGMRCGDLKYTLLLGPQRFLVFNMTADPFEEAPIEEGALEKASPATRAVLAQLSDMMEIAQSLFDSNGFMPRDQRDDGGSRSDE
ncbi:hypothetical protein PINS_up014093 [Pythium insidiosum]|nr:hypothetical protein PINS_up014093 [Pythium insidiosum]